MGIHNVPVTIVLHACSSFRKLSPSSYIDSENVHKIFSERSGEFPVITIHLYICMYAHKYMYIVSIYA